MQSIQTQMIIEGVSSKKDRSLSLRISTPELNPKEKALFMEMQGINLTAILCPMDEPVVDEYKVEKELHEKSPATRLRAVLFIAWKQAGEQGDFNEFYRQKMEAFIEHVKSKLEEEN